MPNQEEHQEVARRIQGFLQTIDARDRIMRFALCTQPFSQMKATILARSEAPWQHRMVVSCLDQGRRTGRPVAMAFQATCVTECLRRFSRLMDDDAAWSCMLGGHDQQGGHVDWI